MEESVARAHTSGAKPKTRSSYSMWTRGLIATLTRFSAIYSPGMLPSPPLMGTAFVGYSFEFVFEGLGHKFRFILSLTEYPPL